MTENLTMHCDQQQKPCCSRFAGITELNVNGIIVLDGNGMVQFANNAAEKLLGRKAGDLQGKTGVLPWPARDGGEIVLHRDGDERVIAEVRMVETEWGGEIAHLAFLRDITDRRRTEDSLRTAIINLEAEKTKSEAIIAAIGDGITIQDTEFKIIYQNEIHKKLMGDHIGDNCYRAYAHREMVCTDCYMIASFQDGSIHTVERSLSTEQGTLHFEITVSPLKDAHGKVIAGIEVVRNITERKQTEENLKYMSSHDILTGLYNRFYFEQELIRLERSRHFPLSVVMADVDDLKEINDTLGHVAGDVLLRQAALLFRQAFRNEDVVARIGGDEFAVLLPDVNEPAVRETVARIRENLRQWNATHGNSINLSLGIATAESAAHLQQALKEADWRMYQDKLARTGRPPRHVRDSLVSPTP
jgi:diguanylate cyclase (GGDEF)-like protein/PAS domain S-box-containing protein